MTKVHLIQKGTYLQNSLSTRQLFVALKHEKVALTFNERCNVAFIFDDSCKVAAGDVQVQYYRKHIVTECTRFDTSMVITTCQNTKKRQ